MKDDKILELLAKITGQEKSTLSDGIAIKDIPGFDSLQFVMMISELKESHNIEIPLDKALEVKTIGNLIHCAE